MNTLKTIRRGSSLATRWALTVLATVALAGCGGSGVPVPASRIYIADAVNRRLVRFDDMIGLNWATIAPTSGADYRGLARDSSGNLYYSTNSAVVKTSWTSPTPTLIGSFSSAQGIFIRGNYLYVADRLANVVYRIDLANTSNVTQTTASLTGPSDVFVTGLGELYITTSTQVVKLNSIGGSIVESGSSFLGPLGVPKGVWVDGSGRVLVADTLNNRILRISGTLGSPSLIERFEGALIPTPMDVATDPLTGKIYATSASATSPGVVSFDDFNPIAPTTAVSYQQFGVTGNNVGEFDTPWGIVIAP